MHALRIAHQGLELLDTGRISLPVGEPARTRLRAVRAGDVPLPEVLAEIEDVRDRLAAAAASVDLPERPDAARIDAFLLSAYRRFWDGG